MINNSKNEKESIIRNPRAVIDDISNIFTGAVTVNLYSSVKARTKDCLELTKVHSLSTYKNIS